MSGERMGPPIGADRLESSQDTKEIKPDQNPLDRLRAKAAARRPAILDRSATRIKPATGENPRTKLLTASHRDVSELGKPRTKLLTASHRDVSAPIGKTPERSTLSIGQNFQRKKEDQNIKDGSEKKYQDENLSRINEVLWRRGLDQWEPRLLVDSESGRRGLYELQIRNRALPKRQRRVPIKEFYGTIGEIIDKLNKYLDESLTA